MFDHIKVVGLKGEIWLHRSHAEPNSDRQILASELEWLCERGIISEALHQGDQRFRLFRNHEPIPPEEFEKTSSDPNDLREMDKFFVAISSMSQPDYFDMVADNICRDEASQLRAGLGWDSVVLTQRYEGRPEFLESGNSNVAHVVLKAMPQPDEHTPWEAILEYRVDPEARGKFFRLKNWMNEAARVQRPLNELEDELRELVYEYQEHMKVHRLKVGTGTLETVINVAAEIAEGIVRLEWSKSAKALFVINNRRVALLEAERSAPGRQLAYIVDAHKRFI